MSMFLSYNCLNNDTLAKASSGQKVAGPRLNFAASESHHTNPRGRSKACIAGTLRPAAVMLLQVSCKRQLAFRWSCPMILCVWRYVLVKRRTTTDTLAVHEHELAFVQPYPIISLFLVDSTSCALRFDDIAHPALAAATVGKQSFGSGWKGFGSATYKKQIASRK